MQDRHFDVLIVGGGPAGSSAALVISGKGLSCLLVDAKTRIGERPHCGEFVPARLFAEYNLNSSSIIQSTSGMETWITDFRQSSAFRNDCPCLDRKLTPVPGFMIDRPRFDRDLARQAASQGAFILSNTTVRSIEHERIVIRNNNQDLSITASIIIAADGAVSTTARIVGLSRLGTLTGIQMEVPLSKPLNNTMIFLDKTFRHGYGWLFPKCLTANVGLGVAGGVQEKPRELLELFRKFLVHQELIKDGCLAEYSGRIPISGLRRSLVHRNMIFCGDAAGLTHPITGAGIPQAIFSGRIAGEIAKEAITRADLTVLSQYESEIRVTYGGVIKHAAAKRKFMVDHWDSLPFRALCHQTWIAFPGYRKRVRPVEGEAH